ncbi:MAG: hypothetical protein A2W09_01760 [Deltaproteobacteria bacterium RBG_16_50_11]|nr:MAG: hypothetical protein A2W09_01760 [Deltaproteobacteria bacterium RBG_16_50_11]
MQNAASGSGSTPEGLLPRRESLLARRDCAMRNLNTQQLLLNLFVKILRSPHSLRAGLRLLRASGSVREPSGPEAALRTCSRLFSIICIALLLGCGYRMVGKETHVPPGLNSIAIPTFINQTYEPGIEITLSQSFLREFIQDRRVKIVDRGVADSYLEGVVKSFTIASVSYNRSGFVEQYLAIAIVDLTMKNRAGEILWKESNLAEKQWFQASSIVLINEANKNIAIGQIGRVLAERIRSRIFYNF